MVSVNSRSTAVNAGAPSNPSRRRIIFTGVAGVAVLAVARWLQPTAASSAATPALSADAADVMRALLHAFLDGALPRDARERDAALDETVDAIAVAISGLPPVAQQELRALFTLLALAPVRVAIAGIDARWRNADVAAINAFLERLRRSRWSQKRAAYDALHQLAFAAWYANPRAWPVIGYPGPPRLP
jgi:hypothetical protein